MERRYRHVGIRLTLASADLLLLRLAFIAAFSVRGDVPQDIPQAASGHDPQTSVGLYMVALVIIHYCGLYSGWVRRSKFFVIYSSIAASAVIVTSARIAGFAEYQSAHWPATVFTAFVIFSVCLTGSRLLGQRLYRLHIGVRRVLVIARDVNAVSALALKFAGLASWFRVEKYLAVDQIDLLKSYLRDIEVVAISGAIENKNRVIAICAQAGKDVLLVPGVSELLLFSSRTEQVDDVLMFSVKPPILSGSQMTIKRSIDLLASCVLALIVSPFLLLVYCLIRWDSAGPAIYRQERVGKDGKTFSVYKFRTMTVDAEKHSGPVLSCERDPRVTRIGRVLRSCRIDELPQLINVVMGDMSFVGPRPERQFFIEGFTREIPGYGLRLNVKPGITGLAQIRGKYCSSAEDKLRLDLMYIANYSPMLDLQIIAQTLETVLLRVGAEGLQPETAVQGQALTEVAPICAGNDS